MNLLIIDDDLNFCEALAEHFRSSNFQATFAHSAQDGLAVAGTASFACILLDWVLPEGRGQDYIEGLRHASAHAPIIMVSALSDMHNVVSSVKAGAFSFLYKPFEFADLERTIQAAVNEPHPVRTQRDVKYELFVETLARHKGNKTNAAKELGVTRQTVAKWLRHKNTDPAKA